MLANNGECIEFIHPLTLEELEHLAEVREVCQTTNSAGWQRIKAKMKIWVEEALADMRQAPYASNEIKAALQMRWSQRESMLMGITQYIESCQDEKEMLLTEARQSRSVPAEDYAEQDRDSSRWENVS